MESIIKRNGQKVAFEAEKIENAVAKAFMATGEIEARDVSTRSRAIELIVEASRNAKGRQVASVEEIQDEVEKALRQCNYAKTAKAYILYRNQHEKVREAENTLIDYKKLVDEYIEDKKD